MRARKISVVLYLCQEKIISRCLESLLLFVDVFSCTETLLVVYELICHDQETLIWQSFLDSYKIFENITVAFSGVRSFFKLKAMNWDQSEVIANIVRQKVRQKEGVNQYTHVLSDGETWEYFMERKLDTLSRSCSIVFQRKPHKKNRDYQLFRCERGGKQRGKNPRKSVGCSCYVSFQRQIIAQQVCVVVCLNKIHSGHDPSELGDHMFSFIDQTLREHIEKFVKLGIKNDIILTLAHSWAREHGHLDITDRRFYVTPEEISEIRRSYNKSLSLADDDASSTYKLLETDFKEETISYQKLDKHSGIPFIDVLQSEWMRQKMLNCSRNVVFMDATYSVTQYGYSLYALCVRDEYGYGVPFVFIILGCSGDKALMRSLNALKAKNPELNPKYV